jgi:hypothetical protein
MDAALRALLREIAAEAPEIAELLERLWRGAYTNAERKTLARSIVELARLRPGLADKILRALAMILRILGIPMPTLGAGGAVVAGGGAAAGGTAAGGTAAGGTAAGGTGAGGTAAGGAGAGAAMTVGAALFMLLAIGILSYRVYRELTQSIDLGDASGPPCSTSKLGELMATQPREVVVDAWSGRKDSMQKAIDEAWSDALRNRGNCDGRCPPGRHCMPVVAVQEVEQWSYFPYVSTYTRLLYTLPCFCVLPDAYWAQFRWDMLPPDIQELWKRLGINEGNWGGSIERTPWEALTREEQDAARQLGFDAQSWNGSAGGGD